MTQRHIWPRVPGAAHSVCPNCGVCHESVPYEGDPLVRGALWMWPDGQEKREKPLKYGGRHWKCGERPAGDHPKSCCSGVLRNETADSVITGCGGEFVQ